MTVSSPARFNLYVLSGLWTTAILACLLPAFAYGLAEQERVGMEFRLGYSREMQEDLASGPGYGVRILFVTPFRMSGYLGGEIHVSKGDPLKGVLLPGWSLRSATSTIYIMPASIGATYVVYARRVNGYVGGGVSWFTLHERTRATYTSGDYVLTEWTNAGGSGPGVHLSLGARYLFNPQFSMFAEVEGLASWIDYVGSEKVRTRSLALFTGLRF
jgi:hypothetical protein